MKSRDETQIREISDWLIESALIECPIVDTIRSFIEKLAGLGLPVHRFNCSTLQRHQIMGAMDCTWDEDSGECNTVFVPRSVIADPNNSKSPVGMMARGSSVYDRYILGDPDQRRKFQMLEDLHGQGYSDYILLKQSFGRNFDWLNFDPNYEATYGAFATKQENGFTNSQIDDIKSLWPAFSLFIKSSTERMLSAKLLEAYLGILPAQNILDGLVERGDGNKINCVLWYSDLRGSTRLSANLATDEYLKLLNNYFDCTAGSVIENGGEVLKFIGDGVMAIFPFDDSDGSKARSCLSALSAARQALSKIKKLQTNKKTRRAAEISFGIGLHLGEVILGNVGTEERLDMTVTGSAANQVTRLETLTKSLALSVLASPQFFEAQQDGLKSIGKYPVPDLGGMTEIFALSEN